MTIVDKIIAFASWYDGRKEKRGKNGEQNQGFYDADFEKEMKSVGWYVGGAWCMFFVILIWIKAFAGDIKSLASIRKTFNGSAKQTADRVIKEGYFETGLVPEPGAIGIFLKGYGSAGHAVIVKTTDFKNNTMYNVEANTNGEGSREGELVNANKSRTIKREFTPTGLNIYIYIYPRLKQKA